MVTEGYNVITVILFWMKSSAWFFIDTWAVLSYCASVIKMVYLV